jgi:hypothetical protein
MRLTAPEEAENLTLPTYCKRISPTMKHHHALRGLPMGSGVGRPAGVESISQSAICIAVVLLRLETEPHGASKGDVATG